MVKKLIFALFLFILFCISTSPIFGQLAVQGEKIYTMAGETLTPGVVLIKDGKIEKVGPARSVSIPKDYRLLKAKVVTPGLIDAHTVVGLSGILNQPHDQDQLDRTEPMQPELRALDAYNPQEELVEWVRQLGVTTIHTGHAPGLLISGQTMVAKTSGDTAEDALIKPKAMVAMTLGAAAKAKDGKAPGTRSKAVAMFRSELVKTQNYLKKFEKAKNGDEEDEPPAIDLRKEVFASVLRQEIPLLITAHRANDIVTALRIAKEFNIKIVLDGAAECYLVLDQIKKAGVPVILHPTMFRATGERENLSFETAKKLQDAGIPFALQSGYESYVPKTRVVLFEAAIAAAYGLSFKQALSSITLSAAKILGIDDRVGSIEVGKDGDLALFDGDPFEYTTHVVGVIIDGKIVSDKPW